MRDVIGRHNNINMPLARWGIIVVSSCLEVYLDIRMEWGKVGYTLQSDAHILLYHACYWVEQNSEICKAQIFASPVMDMVVSTQLDYKIFLMPCVLQLKLPPFRHPFRLDIYESTTDQ